MWVLLIILQSFNKFLLFSHGWTHDLFDRWNHVKLYIAFLCFGISVLHVARWSGFSFSTTLISTIDIRVRSTWKCLQSSSIFRSSMVSLILAGGELGWMSSSPRAGWRKHYSGMRKILKTWRNKLGRSLIRKSWRPFSFSWRTKCLMSFLQRKQYPYVGATSWSLSEEVIGELVDSEAAFLSSPYAWRYTYQVSHLRVHLYYQWVKLNRG